MKEIVQIDNPNAAIRLEGDKYDSVLYLNKVPIQFTWIREIGTTWRYQLAKSIHESDIIEDRSFANFVKYGYLSYELLWIQFDYLISKLESGEYLLEIDYLPSDLYLVELQAGKDDFLHQDDYGGIEDIIQTQAFIDESAIREYIELIQKGIEPIMVVLTCMNSRNRFILDGHHKFIAYQRLKKQPKALFITRLQCRKINKQTGLALFEMCKCQNREYMNLFLQTVKK